MAAVLVGEVPEGHPVADPGDEQIGQTLIPEPADLVGAVADTVRAGPLGEARDLDAGPPQRDHVLRVLLLVGGEEVMGKPPEPEESGSRGRGRGAVTDEVTPSHRLPPG